MQKRLQKKEERVENSPQVQTSQIATKEEDYSKQKGESSIDDEVGKNSDKQSFKEVKKFKEKGQ